MAVLAEIRVSGLRFAYPRGPLVFDGLDLCLETNSLTLLTGANGSGKSTLLRLLCAELQSGAGAIIIDGAAIDPHENRPSTAIYHYPQNPLHSVVGINPAHDLSIWRLVPGLDIDPQKAEADIRAAGIDPNDPWFRMSAGEARKATHWVLPYLRQRYWLMDEPLAGLDAAAARRMIEIIAGKLASGTGALIVTHQPEVFSHLDPLVLEIRDHTIVTGGLA